MTTKIEQLHQIFLNSEGVCTDTRKLRDNQIYFALKGPNFNGNEFAAKALEQGASFAVVDESDSALDGKYLLVDDVLSTLQELAKFHRSTFQIPVIGITGSNGKTTNKELILSVLSRKYSVLATRGNLNNHIGVPLTLLELNADHEIAIIEMGANHEGEITELCTFANPGFALITNIGVAHLEGFGSIEGVKRAKSELFHYVTDHNGLCFINVMLDHIQALFTGDKKQRILFGSTDHPPYAASMLQDPLLRAIFMLNGRALDVESNLIGAFQVNNLLNALVIGLQFEVPEADIRKGLENYRPSNNRGELITFKGNSIILDAYNANPTSTKAAITAFLTLKGKPKMIILGDMFELGSSSLEYHQEIVDLVDDESIERVILVGTEYGDTEIPARFYQFDTTSQAGDWLNEQKISGYDILIKGSRGVHLEELVKE